MAILNNTILKGISGKLGNVVIYELNGKTIARYKPEHINDKKSPKQLAQRQKMTLLNEFLRPFIRLFPRTFGLENTEKHPYQYAKSYNLKHGFKGEYPNIEIDYQNALICKGSVPLPKQAHATVQGNDLLIEWDTNDIEEVEYRGLDTLILFKRRKMKNSMQYTFTGVRRSNGKFLWENAGKNTNKDLQLWIIFRNAAESHISNSMFVDITGPF